MTRRWLAVALAAAFLLPLAPAYADTHGRLSNPAAHAGEIAGQADTDGYVGTRGWRSRTFMVGDSVTHLGDAEGFRPLGLARGWEVSSISGRDVSTLPYYLRDRVDARHPYVTVKRVRRHGHHRRGHRWRHVRVTSYRYPLERAVIALGANASVGWSYADLRSAVNTLPASTVLVFVTPYRDPVLWPDSGSYRVRASVAAVYAGWEARIAQTRPHTCLANWADFARRYPSVLHDGVHPTGAGAKDWARIVAGAVKRCR